VVKSALAHAVVGSASGRTCQTALHFWHWQTVIVFLPLISPRPSRKSDIIAGGQHRCTA
jgi:hypothetical protein